jgi:hypothetical protein
VFSNEPVGCGAFAIISRCSYALSAEKAVEGAEAGTTAGGVICTSTRKVTRPMVKRDTRTGSQAGKPAVVLADDGKRAVIFNIVQSFYRV